ncbi:MAG TPA: Mur ligase family protein [Acidimicrobiales bacterium]|nr:Mur ligase family protein [Acidimicrobiales bacterium]
MTWVAVAACVAALVPGGLRWLRVAQREHYLPETTRFALRWWGSEPVNVLLGVVAVAGVALAVVWPVAALASAIVVVVGPRHLSVRGRTSPLAWTRRLRTLAAVWALFQVAVVVVGVAAGEAAPLAAAGAVLVPVVVDAACLVTAPFERRLAGRYVDRAADRLRRVHPVVVAITGSYGKTSTKNHLVHLVAGTRAILATPASFNNRAGLARAVNEHLADGVEVFVAEMGTYGRGEIAELCRWCPPDIAVITAIGPVHLERFGSEDEILAAKAEIAEGVGVVVLNTDDPRLAALADRLAGPGTTVVRVSATDEGADVCVRRDDGTVSVLVGGQVVAAAVALAPGVQPTNLAAAVAVALRLGVAPADVAARIAGDPAGRATAVSPPANRLTRAVAPSGVVVIDDTFNSNPAGVRAALDVLAGSSEKRRAVVTPGMVELGARQAAENRAFGEAAGAVATDVVVVGRTNRRALLAGAAGASPRWVRTREEAVAWVRANLGPGDAVLYENDLPDHYP